MIEDFMRYLGNKTRLLNQINEVIEKNNIKGNVFADLFAGTGCVGDFFKDRYEIVSNDFLYYSYVLNYAKLNNSRKPRFQKFKRIYNADIFKWLNNMIYVPDESYFVYYNYTPIGNRMFFTEENGIIIDGIRQKIEKLYKENVINKKEYYYLLASLLESVTKISNTSGTYEAYFKFWDSRALKHFELLPLEYNETKNFSNNTVYNEDTNKLVRRISGDIAYIDPPYTVTQYVSAYHMLETIARYDSPLITGLGGKRNRNGKNSLYARRNEAITAFEDLFRQLKFKYILISYSNQGLVSLDDLIDLAKKFAVNGCVQVNYFDYKEYKNHRSSNKRNGKSLNEVIIYFEKDLSINKSPLNYSGSKDKMLPSIIKELPNTVETFVDVMGGAFNVGANIVATNKVVYNEINPYVFEIVKWLIRSDKKNIVNSVRKVIDDFKLEKGNKESYAVLRDAYNSTPNTLYLFVLHMYSFQNMIRFNGSQEFNTPIGVAGFSNDMQERIFAFKSKTPRVEFTNLDYTKIKWSKFSKGTVFYFDPPYFITKAAYNDGKRGMKGWDINDEIELLNILKHLDEMGYCFILSNVLIHNDKKNDILIDWIKENNYRIVNAGVSGWRYAKDEVLIVNY